MALVTTPTMLAPALFVVQGVVPQRYTGTEAPRAQISVPRDYRHMNTTDGFIRDRVVHKSSPTAPEVPYTNARVYVMRLADFYRAWTGMTDALGYYNAIGLEPGVVYVPVAVDLAGTEKCTAGGPVIAQKV
ncbi:hypothetical protein ACFIQG_21785 [Comamonas odontotermitis]|uniref:hypothetical protein n=1 Tax=Comamonas odontotermitis TaxID=379895 RepID=UPI003670C055